jgi:hypothetical protein
MNNQIKNIENKIGVKINYNIIHQIRLQKEERRK